MNAIERAQNPSLNFLETVSIVLRQVALLGCIFLLGYLAYCFITVIVANIQQWNCPYIEDKKYHIILYPSRLQKFKKLLLLVGLSICAIVCLIVLTIIFPLVW